MRVFILIFLFSFLGTLARGQPIEIRTGEHAEFTRVVIFIKPGMNWEFGRSNAGYVLRLPTSDGYAISNFFDLIPKARITAIAQRPSRGELELLVSCICNARPYLYRDGILVIDVADGPAPRISPFELTLDPYDVASELPRPARQTAEFSISQNPVLPLLFSLAGEDLRDAADTLPPTDQLPTDNAPKDTDIVSIFSNEVAEALGAGLSGGLLEPQVENRQSAAADVAIDIADQIGSAMLPGITARTSVSTQSEENGNMAANTQSGQSCLPDRYFALADWGDDRAFHIQIGEARGAVYDDRDQADEAAVTSLAQRFLFFGFGDEAFQTLQLQPIQSQERRYLAAVAKLIEARETPKLDFSGQVSCATDVSLWALLAQGDEGVDADVARDSVLRSFKALPAAVRDLVAPRLAQTFLRLGDNDASRQILSRLPKTSSFVAQAALAEGAFAAAEEDISAALASITPVATDNVRVSPALLAEFFALGVEGGREFETPEFDLANALRFEFSGSPDATQLAMAQLRAHLSMGDFEAARQVFDEISVQLEPTEFTALETEYVTTAVADMDDADFGQYAWSDVQLPTSEVLRSLISERLVSMGFPDRAQAIIGDPADEAIATLSRNEGEVFSDPLQIEAVAGRETSLALPPAFDAENTASLRDIPIPDNSLRENRELIRRLAARRDELTETLAAIDIPVTR